VEKSKAFTAIDTGALNITLQRHYKHKNVSVVQRNNESLSGKSQEK
jgi:hypothetical protein